MSHDRGCSCGLEPYEYKDCRKQDCDRRDSPLSDLVVRASMFPEQCTEQELQQAFKLVKNDIQFRNIERALARRHGLVHISSKRLHLQKPRVRVVAGRAPWPPM